MHITCWQLANWHQDPAVAACMPLRHETCTQPAHHHHVPHPTLLRGYEQYRLKYLSSVCKHVRNNSSCHVNQ